MVSATIKWEVPLAFWTWKAVEELVALLTMMSEVKVVVLVKLFRPMNV